MRDWLCKRGKLFSPFKILVLGETRRNCTLYGYCICHHGAQECGHRLMGTVTTLLYSPVGATPEGTAIAEGLS